MIEASTADDLSFCTDHCVGPAAVVDMRHAIDERLSQVLAGSQHREDRVLRAMRYGVLAPGKRLRPLLILLAGRALGVKERVLMDVACALELVHAASLFVDDLPCMDDANLRRGQPTVHVAFGEDVATLGAVALLAEAWRLAANSQELDAASRLGMVTVLSDAIGLKGLVVGQYRDLHDSCSASVSAATAINHQKTSVLFEAAFEIACLAAGSESATRSALKAAASELGQAFQLYDDLCDYQLSSADTGKDVKQDVGKATLVALIGHQRCWEKLDHHVAAAQQYFRRAMPSDTSVIALTGMLFERPRADERGIF